MLLKCRRYSTDWILFLFGVFSLTQLHIIGSIGISEVVAYLVAPFLFVRDYNLLKNDGFFVALYLGLLACLGCIVASVYNGVDPVLALKGFAQIYSLFAYPVVFHRLLRNNLSGIKWLLLGICISRIINIFVFRQGFEVAMYSEGFEDAETTELIMNGPLFWLQRLGGFLVLPAQGWYYSTPTLYAVVSTVALAAFTIATSDSGRSAFASTLAGAIFLIVGQRRVAGMRRISKNLFTLAIIGLVLVVTLKTGYKYMARNGLLNEKAQSKYEAQVKNENSIISILVGGRSECFAGLLACFDNPIWGFGPWSVDVKGYYGEFVRKYGDSQDYEDYLKNKARAEQYGILPAMPCHSHIVGFWVRYGILGLPYWLYILYLMYRYLRYNITAIPQWFALMSIWVANNLWHVFFSPFGMRIEDCLFVVCLLFTQAVQKGRVRLGPDMVKEIQRKDPTAIIDPFGRVR